MERYFSITLDPTKDGIVGKVDTGWRKIRKVCSHRDKCRHRFIKISLSITAVKDDRLGFLLGFMLYYDKSKLIEWIMHTCRQIAGSDLPLGAPNGERRCEWKSPFRLL